MRTHLSLPTTSLEKSVTFYRALLKAQPMKRYEDYALFVAEDPGLELALVREDKVDIGSNAHFGIAADTNEIVDDAAMRLTAAGQSIDIEREQTCCYAKQNKVWATDPDGRRWEVYYVIEESEKGGNADGDCCTPDTCDSYASCCAS
jgi:catechol 2,3-dioxygenase-like lactoylglutathione lyase family enzyme